MVLEDLFFAPSLFTHPHPVHHISTRPYSCLPVQMTAWIYNAYLVIQFESIQHCPHHWEQLEMFVILQNDKNDSLTYAVVSYSRTTAILKSFDSWVIIQLACAPNRDHFTPPGVSASTHDNGGLACDSSWILSEVVSEAGLTPLTV